MNNKKATIAAEKRPFSDALMIVRMDGLTLSQSGRI
jgi:hypothetical protein